MMTRGKNEPPDRRGITLTVAAVRLQKSGTRPDGRQWQLWEVLDQDGEEFVTFDPRWKDRVGETLNAVYERRERHGQVERILVDESEPNTSSLSDPSEPRLYSELRDELNNLRARLIEVENRLEVLRENNDAPFDDEA